MSQSPEQNGLDGLTEMEALAMDYALGGGSRAERKAAELRSLSDHDFRAAVERWQLLLSPLDDTTPGIAPPPSVWAAIAADVTPQPRRAAAPAQLASGRAGWWDNLNLWRILGLGGPVLAAVSVALLVQPGSTGPAVPAIVAGGPALVATLADAEGRPLMAAAYDPASGQVRFAPVAGGSDAATGKVPELWVIEGQNPPRSLGVIDIAAGRSQAIPRERLAGLKPGAILAISIEPTGGSPTGTPTGPVIATGKLAAA
ncbi:anti-sigma factor domain-containing protein [Sandarakinorhabdus sp.]|uniref:anti-sigma factor n=1 Tax=Sandarakinorhabdus sp. TaxID=1916663 RepID=UPI00286EAE2D|nr:anti-sigma factor [Sandarakinorhabdus sp.]